MYLKQQDLASCYGVARQTIAEWKSRPDPIPFVGGKGHPMPEAGEWIMENYIKGRIEKNENEDFNFHKTRKMKSEADMAERENLLQAKVVIDTDFVEQRLRKFVVEVKETLRTIPLKYAEEIAIKATTIVETKKALREVLDKSLNEIDLELIYKSTDADQYEKREP